MPWPQRVFNGLHPATEQDAEKLRRGSSVVPTGASPSAPAPKISVPMKGIPKEYETELQTVIAALGNMKQSDVRWQIAGTRNVGILVSDTMMFERADPQPSDQYLGSFYGLALPLVMRGVPVEPVQIESATRARFSEPLSVTVPHLRRPKAAHACISRRVGRSGCAPAALSSWSTTTMTPTTPCASGGTQRRTLQNSARSTYSRELRSPDRR